MNRRHFMQLGALFVPLPYVPERVYSFLPAWRLVERGFADRFLPWLSALELHPAQALDKMFFGGVPGEFVRHASVPGALYDRCQEIHDGNIGVIHPSNLLDVQKSLAAYGYPPLPVRS